jgi:hypothetical protein
MAWSDYDKRHPAFRRSVAIGIVCSTFFLITVIFFGSGYYEYVALEGEGEAQGAMEYFGSLWRITDS